MEKLPMWRIIASEGKYVTNGIFTGSVIDCAPGIDPDSFYEIDIPIEEVEQ